MPSSTGEGAEIPMAASAAQIGLAVCAAVVRFPTTYKPLRTRHFEKPLTLRMLLGKAMVRPHSSRYSSYWTHHGYEWKDGERLTRIVAATSALDETFSWRERNNASRRVGDQRVLGAHGFVPFSFKPAQARLMTVSLPVRSAPEWHTSQPNASPNTDCEGEWRSLRRRHDRKWFYHPRCAPA